jgi:hypothetical protein
LDYAGRRIAETDELAEEAQRAAASADVVVADISPAFIRALEWLALGVNLSAGCD